MHTLYVSYVICKCADSAEWPYITLDYSDKCFNKLRSLNIVSNYKRYRTDEFCNRRLKTGSDVVELMSSGSLFQTEAAATSIQSADNCTVFGVNYF